jgi:hypothetical protein
LVALQYTTIDLKYKQHIGAMVGMPKLSGEEAKQAMVEAMLAIPEQSYAPFLNLVKPTAVAKPTFYPLKVLAGAQRDSHREHLEAPLRPRAFTA